MAELIAVKHLFSYSAKLRFRGVYQPYFGIISKVLFVIFQGDESGFRNCVVYSLANV